jgi:hypothetical protein
MSGARSITVEHNGETYTGQIMLIESTMLGAPVKGEDGRFSHREGTAYGLDLIVQILRTVGVGSWEQLVGKHVIVLFKGRSLLGGTSAGIASLVDDRVLILKDHAAAWSDRTDGGVQA